MHLVLKRRKKKKSFRILLDSGEQIYSHGLCCTIDVHSARGQDMYKICTSDSIQKYIGGGKG